jgi:hypothetical protein
LWIRCSLKVVSILNHFWKSLWIFFYRKAMIGAVNISIVCDCSDGLAKLRKSTPCLSVLRSSAWNNSITTQDFCKIPHWRRLFKPV